MDALLKTILLKVFETAAPGTGEDLIRIAFADIEEEKREKYGITKSFIDYLSKDHSTSIDDQLVKKI